MTSTPGQQLQKARILVVDDDKIVLRAAQQILQREGYEVVALDDAFEGLTIVKDPTFDVAVLDIKMPNLSGLDLLRAFKQARPDVEVIMMTAYATIETAVEAVKGGAYDFLTKPFENIDVLSLAVGRAAEKKALRDRNRALEAQLATGGQFEELVGQSQQMRDVFKIVGTVSPSTATVLIQGESGTGKELVARAIHARSPRKNKPFVAVNCSALSDTLLESELFGHLRGSFTGATANKKGLFEAADGGTIFLDEIGDIPPATQVRLLRVLQEGEVKRVGATDTLHVDVRVIAATNVDLARARKAGKFREDLFYRLNVIAVHLPPLRDRPEDVPPLAHHFLARYAQKVGKQVTAFSPAALEALTTYRWTGNVRELENCIERAVVMAPGPQIEVDDLPLEIRQSTRGGGEVDVFNLVQLPWEEARTLASRAFERRYLSSLLERNHGDVKKAAAAAGVELANFRRLLTQHDVAASQ